MILGKPKNKVFSKVCLIFFCFLFFVIMLEKETFALELSVEFATKDKDNQGYIEQDGVIYAKKATQEEIRKKISDTRKIDFIHLCINAKDYKDVTIKNSLEPKFIDVIDSKDKNISEGTYYYKVTKNAVYTVEISDDKEKVSVDVPVDIIGMLGERDTERPVILSLEYNEGNFVIEVIDFNPGLDGIYEDEDTMNKIVDLSSYGNKATVTHKKEHGGYWIRIYDGDDNYRLCKLTETEPRVSYCYKKDNRVKLKVLDSIGLWKITETEDGEPIKMLEGKEKELTFNISSSDVPFIYVYNHANNYQKIELEEYLGTPEISKAYKNSETVTLTAKDPVGLSKVTETVDGETLLNLMGKNITVRFNLTDSVIEDIYVHDEFDNMTKVHLEEDNTEPVVNVSKKENGYIITASDEESGIWKIADDFTGKIIKNYTRKDYPKTITEKIDNVESLETGIRVYDYAGNYAVVLFE